MNDTADHDQIAEALGAYALDSVDPDERALVEAHLPTCAFCRAEVESHRHVASLLAGSGTNAPDGVWERIAGSLREPPPPLRLVPSQPSPAPANPAPPRRPSRRPPRRARTSRVAAAIVAAAAVVVAVLGVQVRQQDRRIDQLQVALRDPLVAAYQSALEDPGSKVIELASADGTLALRGAVNGDGTGYLRATELPRLSPDRTYQLWAAAGQQLISLGVLGSSPEIFTFVADPYQSFAITEEDTPAGVVVTRNQPLVAGRTV